MSASAFISAPDCLVLLSDGNAYPLTGKHVISSTSACKVWKLRQSTGLIWMGARPENINEIVESVKGMDAESSIHKIANILKEGLTAEMLAILDDNNPFNIFTFERKAGGTDYYRLFYHTDKFTPTYKGKLKPGNVGCLSVAENAPDFGELTRKYQQPGKTVETIAHEAFTELIELCNDDRIGGKIFIEKITA
jgi:hypothetical protein